jgi:Maintenance of mitochondrial morphology protein 1
LSFVPSSAPTSSDEGSQNGHASTPTGPGPITLAFSFLPDYRLDLSVRSLMGTRSRLQDVPKIAQLVDARIHSWLDERCVEPRYQEIVLPNLWPRRKNTRGGDEAIDDDEEDTGAGTGAGATREPITPPRQVRDSSTLEVRMAAEGNKLLAAEGRAHEGLRQRPLRSTSSNENLKIPGQFI